MGGIDYIYTSREGLRSLCGELVPCPRPPPGCPLTHSSPARRPTAKTWPVKNMLGARPGPPLGKPGGGCAHRRCMYVVNKFEFMHVDTLQQHNSGFINNGRCSPNFKWDFLGPWSKVHSATQQGPLASNRLHMCQVSSNLVQFEKTTSNCHTPYQLISCVCVSGVLRGRGLHWSLRQQQQAI